MHYVIVYDYYGRYPHHLGKVRNARAIYSAAKLMRRFGNKVNCLCWSKEISKDAYKILKRYEDNLCYDKLCLAETKFPLE